MQRTRVSPAQGSMEYLLLIAGAILVAIIVLLLALAFSPFGQQIFNTNLVEYEKIDLCTGHGASCAFTLDWLSGLLQTPYGMFMDNASDWRTLVVSGVEISLQCGNHTCTQDELPLGVGGQPINPTTSLTLPIDLSSCTQYGAYAQCGFCDVATHLNMAGQACTPFAPDPMNFCPNGPTGDCIYYRDFTAGGTAMITLPPSPDPSMPNPLSRVKLGITLTRLNNGAVTGIYYNFKISQLDSALNLQHSDVDSAISLGFHRSSTFNMSGYSCDLSSSNAPPIDGCDFGAGCNVTRQSDGSYVCVHPDDSTSPFDPAQSCVEATPNVYYDLSALQGAVVRATLVHFNSNQASFVPSLPSGLQFAVHQGPLFEFSTDPSSTGGCNANASTANADCAAACTAFGPQYSANIHLYDLSATPNTPAVCSALYNAINSPSTTYPQIYPGAGSTFVGMSGGCNANTSGPCAPFCYAQYDFVDPLNVMALANPPRDAVVGIVATSGGLGMVAPTGTVFTPILGGAYVTP